MRRWLFVILVATSFPLSAADTWLYGRIVDVQKTVNTKTKAWVVNTPLTEDEVVFTVSVHVADRLVVGTYELTAEDAPPPEEWTGDYPVKVQVVGDAMSVRGPTGDVRLHIIKRKPARPMEPLTADEKNALEKVEAPSQPLTGFAAPSQTEEKPKPEPEAAPLPPPQPANVGTVTVRSTPYLSEVFVDNDSMGYTPAKINLPPGKHTFRVEKPGFKPWTKEMTVTVGSELTLDASLQRTQK